MKILFSPSESKDVNSPFCSTLFDDFKIKSLHVKQMQAVQFYNDFLQNCTKNKKSQILGLSKDAQLDMYKSINTDNIATQYAILRYDGVGFKYLDFNSLDSNAKQNLFDSMYIFSNLFGVLNAKDKIPLYKIKQTKTLPNFDPIKHYSEFFKNEFQNIIQDDLIIDLRAGYYDKFFTCNIPKISLKFLKNGKVVSHYAKAYRGIVARHLAIYNPKTHKDFQQINIPNLSIKEIQKKGTNFTYIYEIF